MSLIYRGTSSDDVHFNVTERRVYNAPAFDVTGIEVPGRSGDVLNSQERFKNKAIVYTGFIRSSDFPGDTTWERLSRGLRTIKAWVCGDAGKYHDLTDDYDPGFVRRAFVSGETAISEVLDRPDGATITITFMAEPFMYEESDPIELPETGTASGAIASFEGVAAPLQSLKFNIEPQQDLHGYDYPWPAGGGTNKVAWSDGIDFTLKGVRYYVSDGKLFLNGTSSGETSSGDATFETNFKFKLPAGTYYFTRGDYPNAVYLIHNVNGTKVNIVTNSGAFTLAAEEELWVGFYVYNKTFSNLHAPIQIVQGSTAPASYAPYSNISPISGWSQADGVAAGKNLIDVTFSTVNASNIITNTFSLKAGTYTLSMKYNGTPTYGVYIRNGSTIQATSVTYWYNATTQTFTLDKDYDTLCISIYYGNGITPSEVSEVMIVQGSTASPYAAPALTPITIALGQTVYGGTVDAIAGKMVITHKGVDMGSKTWLYDATYTRMYTSFNDSLVEATRTQKILCSVYKSYTAGGAITLVPDNSIYNGGTNQVIYIKESAYTDPAAFKTAMTGQTIVYPLATPIEVDLTPVSVSTLLGQNNVWASTGDTEVVYVEPTENPTEWPSKPRLEITMAGAGTLTINGKTWSIGAYTGTLICDSEIMDWYDASNLKNSLVSGDGFPELQPGENVITYTGGITKVVAKPRWRTL